MHSVKRSLQDQQTGYWWEMEQVSGSWGHKQGQITHSSWNQPEHGEASGSFQAIRNVLPSWPSVDASESLSSQCGTGILLFSVLRLLLRSVRTRHAAVTKVTTHSSVPGSRVNTVTYTGKEKDTYVHTRALTKTILQTVKCNNFTWNAMIHWIEDTVLGKVDGNLQTLIEERIVVREDDPIDAILFSRTIW